MINDNDIFLFENITKVLKKAHMYHKDFPS